MQRVGNVVGPTSAASIGTAAAGGAAHGHERLRRCVRPGCPAEAAASMTYGYASRTVWIDDLADESDPHRFDLCARHADRLSVPVGWVRDDRRRPLEPPYQAPIAV